MERAERLATLTGILVINGIEHAGLCASDSKRLAEWYVAVLGFRIVRALEASATYFLRAADGSMLEIYPAVQSSPAVDNVHRGLRHIALSVADVDEGIRHLRAAGVDVPTDTIVVTPDMKLAFFRDPEGNLLHLVQRCVGIPK